MSSIALVTARVRSLTPSFEHVTEVRLHGRLAEEQGAADGGVAVALRDEAHDLELARGEVRAGGASLRSRDDEGRGRWERVRSRHGLSPHTGEDLRLGSGLEQVPGGSGFDRREDLSSDS